MSKPLMLDLCCGRGGWTKGFLAEGWQCHGYDIEPQLARTAKFSEIPFSISNYFARQFFPDPPIHEGASA